MFGSKASQVLLEATIRHHLSNRTYNDPKFSQTIMDNLYVDDLILSIPSIEEAKSVNLRAFWDR